MDGSRLMPDDIPLQAAATASLDRVRLGWKPIVARDRRVLGVRVELRAVDSDAKLAFSSVLALLAEDAAAARGLFVLSPVHGTLDSQLDALTATPLPGVALEIGAEVLTADHVPLIDAAQQRGLRFVLRQSGHPLPRDWQRLFIATVQGTANSQTRDGAPVLWVRDTMTRADVEGALARGAQATIGWPLDEPAVDPSAGLEPTRRAVLDIIRLIQGDADVIALERAFKNEPTLSLLLLSAINSAAFAPSAALSAPITSLRHAILVLGYKRLVRWLVLLLGVSSSNARSMPLVHAAVQRGFFLEALATHASGSRDDLFAVGAFSLLQQITGHSHEGLFASAVLPRPVLDAVRAHEGAYGAFLALAEVLERADATGCERAAQLIGLSIGEVNAALLSSLAAADAITMH